MKAEGTVGAAPTCYYSEWIVTNVYKNPFNVCVGYVKS
jgi:hypothetical protein